jgi:hypothetical protein
MMRLEELGRTVATVQDKDRATMRVTERASQLFVIELRRRSQTSKRTPWLLAAAAMLVIGVGSALLLRRMPPRLELANAPGVVVGQSIVAPMDRSLPLRFSDGSKVELNTGSRANVLSLTDVGATVELQSGKANVSVQHRDSTRWILHAGPYRVRVTGTQFSLEWLPSRSHLELALLDGSVVVTNEDPSVAAVTLRSGERLVIDGGEWHLDAVKQETSHEPEPPDLVAPKSQILEHQPAPAPRTSGAAAEQRNVPVVEWQRLAERGHYADAYRNAEALGIAALASSASAPALLALSETCRFAGHASEAMVVMTKLRQRFPNTNEAAIAAFQLGRLSSSGQLAASWFKSYLKERPNGELAREASGRILEALDRAGDRVGARSAAESYLGRYPSGPHATFARKLIAP